MCYRIVESKNINTQLHSLTNIKYSIILDFRCCSRAYVFRMYCITNVNEFYVNNKIDKREHIEIVPQRMCYVKKKEQLSRSVFFFPSLFLFLNENYGLSLRFCD